jgi:hypothetical protein
VQVVRPFAVDVASTVVRAGSGFGALLLEEVSQGDGIKWQTAGDRRQTFFTPARLARLPAPVAGFGDGLEAGVLERRSLPKILAASTSFFLRSRAGEDVGCMLGVLGVSAPLHTVVDQLLKVGGDFAAGLAVGDHGGQHTRSNMV